MPSKENWNDLSDGKTYTGPEEIRKTRQNGQRKSIAGIQEDAQTMEVDKQWKTEEIENDKKMSNKIGKHLVKRKE